MSDLKPCPFCGGDAIARPSVVCDQWLYAYCKDHTCQGWTVSRCPPARWNTRATPTLSAAMELPEVRALVEALRLAEELYQVGLLYAPIDLISRVASTRRAALVPFTDAKP
jgi:hypothetical protein